jgi:hypothetical protein
LDGATGAQGPQGEVGPTGPQGISITNVSIMNDSLLVYFSNDDSINAGGILSETAFNNLALSLTGSSGSASSWRYEIFGSSGTWVCPAGVQTVFVEIYGGGGGGGRTVRWTPSSGSSITATGGNGGKGGYNNGFTSVVAGNIYPVVVGTGGGGFSTIQATTTCPTTGTNGGDGQASSFAAISAPGGQGGRGGRILSSCSSSNGNVGSNGTISNYPPTIAPPTRSYLPSRVLTWESVLATATGGVVNSFNSPSGENGLVIIWYR